MTVDNPHRATVIMLPDAEYGRKTAEELERRLAATREAMSSEELETVIREYDEDIRSGLTGWIPIFVLLFSALCMGVCGLLIKKCNMKWLENYALPISMLGAMAFAIIISPMIGG